MKRTSKNVRGRQGEVLGVKEKESAPRRERGRHAVGWDVKER